MVKFKMKNMLMCSKDRCYKCNGVTGKKETDDKDIELVIGVKDLQKKSDGGYIAFKKGTTE
eukprot:1874429-Ditylum_brightwellii.AAC.1